MSLKTIKFFKGRIFLVLLGIIIAFSLLLANTIWEDTSEVLILNELNENTDYLATVSSYLPNLNHLIGEYLVTDNLVESIDASILSDAVFNAQDKPPNYQYYPLDQQIQNNENVTETTKVDFSNAIVANIEAMKHFSHVFNINGSYPVHENEIMITKLLAEDLSNLYQTDIGVGSLLNISIARRFPATDAGEVTISAFDLKHFKNFRISGIAEYNGASSILEKIYYKENLARMTVFPFTNNTLSISDLGIMDTNSMIADYLINFDSTAILKAGINGLDNIMADFLERIRSRFWFSTGTSLQRTVLDLQDEFKFSFNSSLLYYPLIILSLLLTHYTIGLLLKGRQDQLKLLQLRGATDTDISILLMIEFTFIAIFGVIIGTPTAIGFAAFIPGLQANGSVDWDLVYKFFENMKIQSKIGDIYQIEVMVLGIFFASAIYHLVTTLLDMHPETENVHHKFVYFLRVLATIILSSLLIIFILQIQDELTLSYTNFDRSLENRLSRIITIMIVVWLLLSQFIADFTVLVLSKLVELSSVFSSSYSFFLSKNLRNKGSLSKVFAFYFIFLFSITIFSTALYTTYSNYDATSQTFAQGADLRIQTFNTFHTYASNLSSIEGVKEVTPVYSSVGNIGTTPVTVYAVDPAAYARIGYWDRAQGPGNLISTLTYLEDHPNSVIISGALSSRLGLELNQDFNLQSFENEYILRMNITGIIDSAPGLGLSGSHNPELNQYSSGWVLVSLDWVNDNFNLINDRHFTELFFASLEDGANVDDVKSRLLELENVDYVNPIPINRNFIGVFVGKFLPSPQAIVRFSALVTTIITFIMMFLITGYMLENRKKEYALMIAVGAKRNQVTKIIYTEIISLTILSMVVAGIYGILITKLSLYFFIPYTLKKLYFPITLDVNFGVTSLIALVYLLEILIVVTVNKRRIIVREVMGILLDRGK